MPAARLHGDAAQRRLSRQQGCIAAQALHGLRLGDDLATPLGKQLGRREVLLRSLPTQQGCTWMAHGDTALIGAALKGFRRVRSIDEPHLAPWLARWAECGAAPALFSPVDRRCDSFSKWWTRASRGLDSAANLLAINEVPA